MESIFDGIQQNLESMLGIPFVTSAVTLGLVFYGHKAGPELPSFLEELFLNVFFQIFVGFMVLFMSTGNVILSFIVSAVFVYLVSNTKESMIGGFSVSGAAHHASSSASSAAHSASSTLGSATGSFGSSFGSFGGPGSFGPGSFGSSTPSLEDLGNEALKTVEKKLKEAFKKFRDDGKNAVSSNVNSISDNVEKTKNNIEEKQKSIKPL